MYAKIRNGIASIIQNVLQRTIAQAHDINVLIDAPADKANGDFSCNIALQLSRLLKKSPQIIAQELFPQIEQEIASNTNNNFIDHVEIKGGFINFYLSLSGYYSFLEDALARSEGYGQSEYGEQVTFNLEFVSANPTGPLTVAHGRQAAVGDTLVNILRTVGFDAKKEYYVNDEGNQINILGRSLCARAKELFGSTEAFFEEGYQGEYIREMARLFVEKQGITSFEQIDKIDAGQWRLFGVDYLMAVIKRDLIDFDVHFDVWSEQSKIATLPAIKDLLEDFKTKGFIYEHEGALWFKSTLWGDDKDRVVQKSNGDYTYLTPDIVYHKNKFERGFKRIINILGPDHHGYIPRIKAAAGALGKSPDDLDVIIVQLATIFRDGKEVSMSTRRGEFITLREVIDEVGRDAGRFFFLMRQSSAHLEFDLELAKRQSSDNPVYYVQYAHARICSILAKAQNDVGLSPKSKDFKRLKAAEEIDLMRKIGFYPQALILCAKTLEPFALVRYVQEMAGCFHKFYDVCRVIEEDQELSTERLALINATRIVLANSLKLLGVAAPEKM